MAAGDVVVIGDTGFTQDGEEHEYIDGSGWFFVKSYSGPDAGLAAQEQALRNAGAVNIRSRRGPVCTITAHFEDEVGGTGDSTSDEQIEWTLIPYDLNKELGTHGVFNKSGVSPGVIARIDRAIKDGTVDDTDWETEYSGTGEYDGYADLRARGTSQWVTFGFRLRKTVVANSGSIVNDIIQSGRTDEGKIQRWSQIGVPIEAKILQPRVRHYVGVGVDAPVATEDPSGASNEWAYVLIEEWMKKPLQITYQRVGKNRKRRFVQDWLGAVQWNALLYENGTGLPST